LCGKFSLVVVFSEDVVVFVVVVEVFVDVLVEG